MSEALDKILVVIPSLNPDEKFMMLLSELKCTGFSHILVVNDGSADSCAPYFEKAAGKFGCDVLCHHVNLGKGRALKTAFNHFLNAYPYCDGLVTVDADGQHRIEDIRACSLEALAYPDALILGSRNFYQEDVPFKSRYGNLITRNVFHLLCGIRVSDTQTGLRAMSRPLVQRFLTTSGERFEYEMNMLIDCAESNIPMREVPIATVYIEQNASSHFHPVRDALRVYQVFNRYLISAVFSFLADIVLFALLYRILQIAAPTISYASVPYISMCIGILIATAVARLLSSTCHYLLSRRRVLRGRDTSTFIKYYALAAVTCWLSAQGVSFITCHGGWNSTAAKIMVDIILLLISLPLWKRWVFQNKKPT